MQTMPARRTRAAAVAAVGATVGLVVIAGCAHGARRTGASASTPRPAAAVGGDKNVATDADWRGRSVQDAAELFQGRFPGVQVYAAPGGMVVRVRSATTLTGSGEPLYIIDGLPVPAGTGGLVSINPGDVARIEVLKDAADLAEYGSRAGNGVVRITTKRPPPPKS